MSRSTRPGVAHYQQALSVTPTRGDADPDRVRRFEQEARAIASLNHPHICQIYTVQDEIATSITAALQVTLSPSPQPARRHVPDLQAYEHYLKALYDTSRRTPESMTGAQRHLEPRSCARSSSSTRRFSFTTSCVASI